MEPSGAKYSEYGSMDQGEYYKKNFFLLRLKRCLGVTYIGYMIFEFVCALIV